MFNFKMENGKYIVTVNGNKCIFDICEDAMNYIAVRRFINF